MAPVVFTPAPSMNATLAPTNYECESVLGHRSPSRGIPAERLLCDYFGMCRRRRQNAMEISTSSDTVVEPTVSRQLLSQSFFRANQPDWVITNCMCVEMYDREPTYMQVPLAVVISDANKLLEEVGHPAIADLLASLDDFCPRSL